MSSNSQSDTVYCADYRGVNAVVVGASGFIGRWVARTLSVCGANLSLLVRNKTSAAAIFSEYRISGNIVEFDLTSPQADLLQLFQTLQPTIVFNLAGYGVDRSERDEAMAYQINTELLRYLCEAVTVTRDNNWAGQDLVHVGTALEYGEIDGNLAEDTSPNPTTLYGKSKLAGTHVLSDYSEAGKVKGITARLFTVYGPGEHAGRLVPALLDASRNQNPLPLTAGLQQRDFTYVKDIAEGLLRLGLCKNTSHNVVNLATGQLTSVREFTETAAEVLAIAPERLKFGEIPTRAEEMAHSPVSITRLQSMLDWYPTTSIKAGIKATADFYS